MQHSIRGLLVGAAMVACSLAIIYGVVAALQMRDQHAQLEQYARDHPM
jgi:hypothetical protein